MRFLLAALGMVSIAACGEVPSSEACAGDCPTRRVGAEFTVEFSPELWEQSDGLSPQSDALIALVHSESPLPSFLQRTIGNAQLSINRVSSFHTVTIYPGARYSFFDLLRVNRYTCVGAIVWDSHRVPQPFSEQPVVFSRDCQFYTGDENPTILLDHMSTRQEIELTVPTFFDPFNPLFDQ